MSQQVEISTINFSGQEANIIFTPTGSEVSYGLGKQTLPYIFNTSIIGKNINVSGKYSINIVNTNCSYMLLI